MVPWYHPNFVDSPGEADYVISYLSEKQRNIFVRELKPYMKTAPSFVVRLDGRAYVELYPVRK